jgi:hypothetical protein
MDVRQVTCTRIWQRLAAASLLLIVVLSFVYTRVLSGIAEILVYEEAAPVARHVLLWDRSPYASQATAKTVGAGVVKSVIIFECPSNRLQRSGIVPRDSEQASSECMDAGVPRALLQIMTSPTRGNSGKCEALAKWLGAHPSDDIIVLCDAFRTRALRWEINQRFSVATARRVRVQPWWPRNVSVCRWWRSEEAINGVIGGWVHLLHPVLAGRTYEDGQECNPEQFSPVRQ